jgi:hypothetical protein
MIAQPAKSTKNTQTTQTTAEDVREVQTRDQDRHGTITDALVIAKANHIAPGVQHTGIDKTTESDIPELLKTTTTTKSKSLSRNLQNLPPPTTTNPPTHQTPTPTTP